MKHALAPPAPERRARKPSIEPGELARAKKIARVKQLVREKRGGIDPTSQAGITEVEAGGSKPLFKPQKTKKAAKVQRAVNTEVVPSGGPSPVDGPSHVATHGCGHQHGEDSLPAPTADLPSPSHAVASSSSGEAVSVAAPAPTGIPDIVVTPAQLSLSGSRVTHAPVTAGPAQGSASSSTVTPSSGSTSTTRTPYDVFHDHMLALTMKIRTLGGDQNPEARKREFPRMWHRLHKSNREVWAKFYEAAGQPVPEEGYMPPLPEEPLAVIPKPMVKRKRDEDEGKLDPAVLGGTKRMRTSGPPPKRRGRKPASAAAIAPSEAQLAAPADGSTVADPKAPEDLALPPDTSADVHEVIDLTGPSPPPAPPLALPPPVQPLGSNSYQYIYGPDASMIYPILYLPQGGHLMDSRFPQPFPQPFPLAGPSWVPRGSVQGLDPNRLPLRMHGLAVPVTDIDLQQQMFIPVATSSAAPQYAAPLPHALPNLPILRNFPTAPSYMAPAAAVQHPAYVGQSNTPSDAAATMQPSFAARYDSMGEFGLGSEPYYGLPADIAGLDASAVGSTQPDTWAAFGELDPQEHHEPVPVPGYTQQGNVVQHAVERFGAPSFPPLVGPVDPLAEFADAISFDFPPGPSHSSSHRSYTHQWAPV